MELQASSFTSGWTKKFFNIFLVRLLGKCSLVRQAFIYEYEKSIADYIVGSKA
jgi:hypothetical protein